MPQEEVQIKRKKKKQDKKIEFDVGKVFSPEKEEDVELDLGAARFKAQKGQGGDRRN